MTLVEPAPRDPAWPRYSDLPFPAYRFVPGLHPHPRRHPKGHSYGTAEVPPPRVAVEEWRKNAVYLHGVDLYNFAYWWECHEALEGLWHLTGHTGTEAQFLQGIIQTAAANLQRHMGHPDGARRLGREGIARLASVGLRSFMGLELGPFIREVNDYHVDEDATAIPLIRLSL